jgi:hypothetical protein
MKIRFSTTLVSALLMSLCLMFFIPASLQFASTWKILYYDETLGFREPNLLMPLGFCALGFEVIGLIVLWTGYRKKECWAWFVMLSILLFFVFPDNVLKLLLEMQTPAFQWPYLLNGIRDVYWPSISTALGVLDFLVMLVALLLPIKAFFWRAANSKVVEEHLLQNPLA